ncbi:antibiotic biosynthesis monooxygenase [Agromyces aurantiacus]|uniref:Antibiotic biosynthesis monooxygenase n=1 Tax=Agromyces aurantiacus TaxID=165814 RepID=A0ABV9R5T6_9MICO|nr:antibiotic biosynthesis monooxygenase [Agromyces aurantiacus]MBM7506045.1 antibiotic biosynthesis monooxygenase (ABM) superfamily enzyme [Agromyces aurantiacus]
MGSEPITVSIRREVDPDRIAEATVWVQTGVNLANRYPGFLGSGWVRAGEHSDVWHMLYRFANEETLEAWERSPERAWWLEMGRGFVRAERARRRTGIEGWFDEPATGSVPAVADGAGPVEGAALPPAPPRWKQAVSIWLGFFPVNLAFALLVSLVPAWEGVPLALRVLLTTLVLTPIMTYWVLPWVTRMLRNWLAPRA